MRFATKHDAQLFLMEIGELDKLETASKDLVPTEQMLELFIRKRKSLIPGLRNFRKAQATKAQWRQNRYKLLKGIKRFHSSTKGKRMHRAIGRFLATRDFSKGMFNRESFEDLNIHDVCETLKAISAVKTHNYIEFEYYHPIEEEIQYMAFTEELLPTIGRIETALLTSGAQIDGNDLDFLIRVCEEKAIHLELASAFNQPLKDIQEYWNALKSTPHFDETAAYAYLGVLNKTKYVFGSLNETIEKRGDKYVLVSKEGKVLGSHDSRAEAEAQETAIQIAKAAKK